MPIKIIGIRPGEKLDEVMCPSDDSHLTIEFKDHYVITPSIIFFSKDFDFTKNQLGETGEYVDSGFEYQSGSNEDFLTIDQIKEYN
jgi:UDP-N-acetylglucosamine 4,6-dehydratase